MRSAAILLSTICLVTACASVQWIRADATPEQINHDLMQCRQDAWREARLRPWNYQPIGPMIARDAAGRNFAVSPGPLADPFGDPFMEEGRLAQLCMRSKGYELAPADKTSR